jgi:hypothetical protein
MLRVYSDRAHYSEDRRRFVNDIAKAHWNDSTSEERRAIYGTRYSDFAMVDAAESADIVVLTMKWQHYVEAGLEALAIRALDGARRARKPFVVFCEGDFAANFPVGGNDIHMFEAAGYHSRRKYRVHGMPPLFEDPLPAACGGVVQVRPKEARPSLGFCGQAGGSRALHLARAARLRWRWAQWRLGRLKWEPTPFEHTRFRQRVLDTFADSPLVATRYVLRTKYRAGIQSSQTRNDLAEASRREFVENVLGTDYTICVRGGGNFSLRFYEALALGRAPVLIDTDCALPFHDLVDWRRYMPWIDARDLAQAPQIVADFHAQMTDEEYREHQNACRALWVDRLSPDGFFSHFHEHFTLRG